MAENLKDVMAYLLKHYAANGKNKVSNTVLNNLIYLCDWCQAVKYGEQITAIKWCFSHAGTGLFTRNVQNAATDRDMFTIEERDPEKGKELKKGDKEHHFSLKDRSFQPQISDKAKESLDIVIRETVKLSPKDFMQRVNRTYLVKKFFKPGQSVNLLKIAKEYKAAKK